MEVPPTADETGRDVIRRYNNCLEAYQKINDGDLVSKDNPRSQTYWVTVNESGTRTIRYSEYGDHHTVKLDRYGNMSMRTDSGKYVVHETWTREGNELRGKTTTTSFVDGSLTKEDCSVDERGHGESHGTPAPVPQESNRFSLSGIVVQ